MHSWGGEIYRSVSLSGALRCLRGRRMGIMSDKKASKDMETVLVVVIAVFVAWIAVNHFRLVNARVEAAKSCEEAK